MLNVLAQKIDGRPNIVFENGNIFTHGYKPLDEAGTKMHEDVLKAVYYDHRPMQLVKR